MASLSEFDREQTILLDLDEHGRVEVGELAARFGVSAVTIRKDLENLERRSMLKRIRGGALVAERTDEGAFEFRQRVAAKAKRAIARRAAELVRPGDVIAIDSSTTCFYLAEEIAVHRPAHRHHERAARVGLPAGELDRDGHHAGRGPAPGLGVDGRVLRRGARRPRAGRHRVLRAGGLSLRAGPARHHPRGGARQGGPRRGVPHRLRPLRLHRRSSGSGPTRSSPSSGSPASSPTPGSRPPSSRPGPTPASPGRSSTLMRCPPPAAGHRA